MLKTAVSVHGRNIDKSFETVCPSSLRDNMTLLSDKDKVHSDKCSGLSAILMMLYIGFFNTMTQDPESKRRLKFVQTIGLLANDKENFFTEHIRALGLILFSTSDQPVRTAFVVSVLQLFLPNLRSENALFMRGHESYQKLETLHKFIFVQGEG